MSVYNQELSHTDLDPFESLIRGAGLDINMIDFEWSLIEEHEKETLNIINDIDALVSLSKAFSYLYEYNYIDQLKKQSNEMTIAALSHVCSGDMVNARFTENESEQSLDSYHEDHENHHINEDEDEEDNVKCKCDSAYSIFKKSKYSKNHNCKKTKDQFRFELFKSQKN